MQPNNVTLQGSDMLISNSSYSNANDVFISM